MRYRRQEAVGVRREVDAGESRLEVEHSADEGGVLVREAVVLLPCPRRGLDVVERAAWMAPRSLVRLSGYETNISMLRRRIYAGAD